MKINFKKLTDTAKTPTRGTKYSAGLDLYADEDVIIEPHTNMKIKTNIAMEIPEGYFGAIYSRSGISIKNNLRLANCVGVIDSDYRGNIIVALHNDGNIAQEVKTGDRIAQLIIQGYLLGCRFSEVEELSDTERGENGFGSTGMK